MARVRIIAGVVVTAAGKLRPGGEGELPEEQAEELVRSGVAVRIAVPEPTVPEPTVPEPEPEEEEEG